MSEGTGKYYAVLWCVGAFLMLLSLSGNIACAIVGGFIFLACHVGLGLESLNSEV